jgi:ABC-type polysaccharide/polyol phosphate transport system ATPase subunit
MTESENLMRLIDMSLTLPLRGKISRSLKTVALKRSIIASNSHLILDRVNLTVDTGQFLGIIGRNGSGKSTLLRVMSGIYEPTSGLCVRSSESSPMLEVQSILSQDLSLEDNIKFYACLMGIDLREAKQRSEEILEWSELTSHRKVIAGVLSTGMQARFAFALVTEFAREIVIIDETFAVGDLEFSNKAILKIQNLQAQGKTLVVVTHDLDLLDKYADSCLWLEKGQCKMYGSVQEVTLAYRNSFQ